jgi:type II secretory ATPase GspE/PulE/Tfp pilus assembly ATPase PilB-like protein
MEAWMRLERKTVDFRVSILPSVFGESVVIRILDREATPRCFCIAVGTTRVQ